MLRIAVVQSFTDKVLKKEFKKNDFYPYELVSKERLEELLGDEHANFNGPIIRVVEGSLTEMGITAEDEDVSDEDITESTDNNSVEGTSNNDVPKEDGEVDTDEETSVAPTDKNTVAEITAYLDEHNINHDGVTKKAELLALI